LPIAPDLSRQQREIILATSGPRRTTPTKKPAEKTPPPPDFSKVEWGYAGLGGPENWGKLRPHYATCATGKRQSPIDIRGDIKVDLEPIQFDYRPSEFRIVDNGHTIEVEVGEGNSITIMGRNYPLRQIHFHRPAEERINGKPFEMVAHLVHKDYDNSTAVVAVLMERGAEHPLIQTLWNHLPLEVGMELMPPNVSIDLGRLLPERREYYTYMGSLTTPPCTENVLWLVMKHPIQVAPQQISIFSRLYPNNARPLQQSNDRLIKGPR
jgi:carbonic anhydrase